MEAVQSPNQVPKKDNIQDIKTRQENPSLVQELITSSVFTFFLFLIIYLFFNLNTRLNKSSGFSNFPLPPDERIAFDLLSVSHIITIFLAGYLIFAITRFLVSKKQNLLSIAVLFGAPVIISLIFFYINRASCIGVVCGLFVFVLTIFVFSSISISLLNNYALIFFKKSKYRFKTFIVFVGLIVLGSLLVPIIFNMVFGNRVVVTTKVNASKVEFTREEITKSKFESVTKLEKVGLYKPERRLSGEVVLERIDDKRTLIQKALEKDSGGDETVELFIEREGKLFSITGDAYIKPGFMDNIANVLSRSIFLSPDENQIAFQLSNREPDFYVVNLDSSGVFIEKNFCPGFCDYSWGENSFIYVKITQDNPATGFRDKITYWELTTPK